MRNKNIALKENSGKRTYDNCNDHNKQIKLRAFQFKLHIQNKVQKPDRIHQIETMYKMKYLRNKEQCCKRMFIEKENVKEKQMITITITINT